MVVLIIKEIVWCLTPPIQADAFIVIINICNLFTKTKINDFYFSI